MKRGYTNNKGNRLGTWERPRKRRRDQIRKDMEQLGITIDYTQVRVHYIHVIRVFHIQRYNALEKITYSR